MLTTYTGVRGVRMKREMATVDGQTVVFLIGMRINSIWRFWAWVPLMRAMTAMLRELLRHPELGLLGARTYWSGRVILVVQYWRSFDALEHYARHPSREHLPAWKSFYARAQRSAGAAGIFHETYVMGRGQVETLYTDMPNDFGLAGAVGSTLVSAGRNAARARLET